MEPAEKDFIAKLPKEVRKSYVDGRNAINRQLKTKYQNEREAIAEPFKKGIETERKHRAILNSCVFPFTETGSLVGTGYRFVRASPLAEYGLPNTDFLLYKDNNRYRCAIFGECKSSTASAMEVVNQMRDRMAVAEAHRDLIAREYLMEKDYSSIVFEPVIAAPPADAHQVLNRIIETGGGITVWSVEMIPGATLSLCEPPRRDIQIRSIDGQDIVVKRASLLHKDKELVKSLANPVDSNSSAINTFPKTHRVLEMLALVRVATVGEKGLMVTKERLRDYLKSDLFYMSPAYIDELANRIIEDAMTIKVLEYRSEEHAFRLIASGSNRTSVSLAIEKKWVDHQVEEMYLQERDEVLSKLKKEATGKIPRRATLDPWL
ncbi:MAG: hypothetical protein A4E32_00489 [Methanomassiliicoccales archaeon PtaU1.Bin124]|nr:MAG: hypothetical protein A4E32_00489 [Methanomassiliicoccales archaeon PtaU1.Bin124]